MALPQNRQERNIISSTVSENLPDFVRQDHPTFLKFVETYYEWLESKENSYFAPLSLNGIVDIDKTSSDFVQYFRSQTMDKFPENLKSVKGDTVDTKNILKRIRSFYLAKGTENSIEFLIRLLFDVYVETYRPADDIFKSSGGFWYAPTVVRCTDSEPTENSKIRGQLVEFFDGGKVIGTAVVDEIHQFVLSGNSILELELTNISSFSLTDNSYIKIPTQSGLKRTESLYSLIIDIEVSTPTGSFYSVDDGISTTGTNGSGFKGSVESVDKNGSIRKIRIDEPGVNYLSDGQHVVSVTTSTGIGATFESPSYGYLFNKPGVYQNNDGKLSSTEILQDNFRYQMHSYVIRTEASLHEYESTLKDLVHPSGKKVLGDYFVYRKGFGPSADFVGYRQETLHSPFFANYLPYSLATIADGALTGSNNNDFGVVDSSIDLRGVCAASISNTFNFGSLYYDFFPFGYDGSTGYTLDFTEVIHKTPKTELGDGLSFGSINQDLNKFGGVNATKEFFARLGESYLFEQIDFEDRSEDLSRSFHAASSFQNGDIIRQEDGDGNTHAKGIIIDSSWNTNSATFNVLRTSGSNNGFRTARQSDDGWTATDSTQWKIFNETRGGGSAYTGGSDYRQHLRFDLGVGSATGEPDRSDYVNFFKPLDHVWQYDGFNAPGQSHPAYGIVEEWLVDREGVFAGCTLTIKLFGTSTPPKLFRVYNANPPFSNIDDGAIHRIKGANHPSGVAEYTDQNAGSTSGGETFFGPGHEGVGGTTDAASASGLMCKDNQVSTVSGRLERSFGGVIEDVNVLVDNSNTGSTLPGWPSGGTDFWIVHPHPNVWHGNVPEGLTWGGITLQSFLKTPYKLTSAPVKGASGSSVGGLSQINNIDIPGGYGS